MGRSISTEDQWSYVRPKFPLSKRDFIKQKVNKEEYLLIKCRKFIKVTLLISELIFLPFEIK